MSSLAIRSMTGFGSAAVTCGLTSYEVEVRALNHRFLDISVRLPKDLSFLEIQIRSLVAAKVKRGKVDLTIVRKAAAASDSGAGAIKLQRPLFDAYVKLYRDLLSEFASGMRPESFEHLLGEILAKPGVIADSQLETGAVTEAEVKAILEAVQKSLDALGLSKAVEGAAIERDIRALYSELRGLATKIHSNAPDLATEAKKRLEERIKKLFPETGFDEGRLVQEACFIAERFDIAEELQRLSQHLDVFESALKEEAPGKRLDFLVQEINREANTIASKSQNAPINHMVVEAKVAIEKIREQLQNIE